MKNFLKNWKSELIAIMLMVVGIAIICLGVHLYHNGGEWQWLGEPIMFIGAIFVIPAIAGAMGACPHA